MLSDFDKKLLYELDFNARKPISYFAKKLKVSKQLIAYHIQRLEKEHIIQGFYTDINPARLGYNIYLVYLKFNSPENELKEFISLCSKKASVGVNVSCYGKWDHCIGIWAKNLFDFESSYKEIFQSFEKYVIGKEVNIETSFYYFKPLFGNNYDVKTQMNSSEEHFFLDSIDKEILNMLSENCRISLLEVSRKVDLVPNSVKYRIKQLEEKDIILNYRVMINYDKLGYMHYRVFLNLAELEDEKSLITLLGNFKQIISITKTIGTSSMEFRAMCTSIPEFISFMNELKLVLGNSLRNYESLVYTQFHDVLNYHPFNKN